MSWASENIHDEAATLAPVFLKPSEFVLGDPFHAATGTVIVSRLRYPELSILLATHGGRVQVMLDGPRQAAAWQLTEDSGEVSALIANPELVVDTTSLSVDWVPGSLRIKSNGLALCYKMRGADSITRDQEAIISVEGGSNGPHPLFYSRWKLLIRRGDDTIVLYEHDRRGE